VLCPWDTGYAQLASTCRRRPSSEFRHPL